MIKSNQNRILEHGFCCINCGKNYKTRTNLDKHLVLCETLIRAKTHSKKSKKEDDEIEYLPTQKQMYKIILDLALKCNHLEEKLEQMQKWVVKQKKKINIFEWLQEQEEPTQTWSQFISKIIILNEETELILHNPFINVLNEICDRIFQDLNQDLNQNLTTSQDKNKNSIPFVAFTEKQNTFYIYEKDESENLKWRECSKKDLINLLNNIHFKMVKSFIDLKKKNEREINESDNICELFNKSNIKIMEINFKNDQIFNKAKSLIYNKIKIELKKVIEYEFEF